MKDVRKSSPILWKMLHTDKSNKTTNTFGGTEPCSEKNIRVQPRITYRTQICKTMKHVKCISYCTIHLLCKSGCLHRRSSPGHRRSIRHGRTLWLVCHTRPLRRKRAATASHHAWNWVRCGLGPVSSALLIHSGLCRPEGQCLWWN